MGESTSNQNNEPEKQKEETGSQPNLSGGYYLQFVSTSEEVNLLELWEGITSRIKLVILIITLFTCLGILLAVVLPKKYLGEVVIAEAQYDIEGTISTKFGEDIPDLTVQLSTNEALAILESRVFLYKFIEDNGLLPILFDDKWDKDKGQWKDELEKDDIPTNWDGHEKFIDDVLDITLDTESSLTTISIKWTEPKLSAEWANKLIDKINSDLRQRAIEEAEKIIEQLNQQLLKTSVVDLQQALYDLMKVQMAKIVSARVHKEYAFKIIDRAVIPEDQAIKHFQIIIIGVGFTIGLIISLSFALFLNTLQKLKDKQNSN